MFSPPNLKEEILDVLAPVSIIFGFHGMIIEEPEVCITKDWRVEGKIHIG